ncbi:MAG: nitrous oxide reductase accessory protein NosL [Magnetospirillum sp. WYHS-4]
MKVPFHFLAVLLLVITACDGKEATGPEEIKWDRDICTLCTMAIADARFATQVRGGPKRKVFKFDDIGCAVNWLNEQPWAGDAKTEIWTADLTSTRAKVSWLDGRKAFYTPQKTSPMGYGYGAQAEPGENALSFEDLTRQLLQNGPNHICPVKR